MRLITYIFLILFLTVSCTTKEVSHIKGSANCCEDSAMAHFTSNPDESISLLDSAEMAGNLTKVRANYLKAMVVYAGKKNADSCINMCNKLIDDEAWKELKDSDEMIKMQVDLYCLIATAGISDGNYIAAVNASKKGIALAHGKRPDDEADLLSKIGYMECQQNYFNLGIPDLEKAARMTEGKNTWNSEKTHQN